MTEHDDADGIDIYASLVRDAGDLAAFFEYDGETGYFYLFRVDGPKEGKVLKAIRVVLGSHDLEERDVEIRWNPLQDTVGVFLKGQLWACYDASQTPHSGGLFALGARSELRSDDFGFGLAS